MIKLYQYVYGYAYVSLGEIADVTRGGNFQKKHFVEKGKPCIHYGQIYTRYGLYSSETLTYLDDITFNKSKKAKKGDIVMAVTSENVDDVCKCVAWQGNEDAAISGHTAIIHHNQNSLYLAHWFNTDAFRVQKERLAHGTKVIEVTPDKLKDIILPLPPMEKQNEIVEKLNRFDELVNDISKGIPAEIELNNKRYEYYRDKLLSFPEKNHIG